MSSISVLAVQVAAATPACVTWRLHTIAYIGYWEDEGEGLDDSDVRDREGHALAGRVEAPNR